MHRPLAPHGMVNASGQWSRAFAMRTGRQGKHRQSCFAMQRKTMRDYRDAKAMAASLKKALAAKSFDIGHSESLELVAKAFGMDSWNVLSAKIGTSGAAVADENSAVHFLQAIPVIRIFDVDKAKEFYCGYLGFAWNWEHRFEENMPVYASVVRSPLEFHLSQHHGDGSLGTVVFVPMTGVEDLHRELAAKNYAFLRPGIENHEWGRAVNVTDPFGTRIRFTELKSSSEA
jgi:hypothetical protein